MQQTVIRILEKEAEKRNMPFSVIKEVYMSQFRGARRYLTSGVKNKPETFVDVRIPFLGKFMTTEARILKYVKDETSKSED